MEETSNFYFLYNIKQEPIPNEEEWALRYEQFAKRVPPMEDGDESDVLSDVEENEQVNEEFDETMVSSDVEERGAKFDSGHDLPLSFNEGGNRGLIQPNSHSQNLQHLLQCPFL